MRSWSEEDEDEKITRRPEDNKAHAVIHKGNRQTRNIRGKDVIGTTADGSSHTQKRAENQHQ